MKNLLISLGLILVLISQANAAKLKGLVCLRYDTIQVSLDIPLSFSSKQIRFDKMQMGIRCFDPEGKIRTIGPGDWIEIRFNYMGEQVRMISVPNTLSLGAYPYANADFIFLKLRTEGRLRVFDYYRPLAVVTTVLQKKLGYLRMPTSLNFKKKMQGYFDDCPVLDEKIRSKEWGYNDLAKVISYYNESCNSVE